MKVFNFLFSYVCLFLFCDVIECQFEITEVPLARCVLEQEDGNEVVTEYDVCTSFCCGGFVVDNTTNLECCGSVAYGRPYNPKYEQCCSHWTGHGMGHVRPFGHQNLGCCGTNTITWGLRACCYGYPGLPQVFNFDREICCNTQPVALPANTPSRYASCCGRTVAYDRRFQSCPCNDGVIQPVVATKSGCCETPEGLRRSYNKDTQICCENGQVGTIGVNFCCGGTLGEIGDNVCCSGSLVAVEPRNVSQTQCCVNVPYDPNSNLCCGDEVMTVTEGANQCCNGIPYNPIKSICCETTIWSRETQGNLCCGTQTFFKGKGSFCCGRDVFLESDTGGDTCCGSEGDLVFYFQAQEEFICCNNIISERRNGQNSCCGTLPFISQTQICCSGQVHSKLLGDSCCQGRPYFQNDRYVCCDDGPYGPFKSPRCCTSEGYDVEGGSVCCGERVFGQFKWPACCVDEGYDAFTHVCCGAIIYPIPNGGNQGSCCGNRGYDRGSQLCCSGENVTIPANIPQSRAQCCNFDVYNTDTQLCCSGVIREKTNIFTTKCCGTASYSTTEQICCEPGDDSEPILNGFEYGAESTGCCGAVLFNTTAQYCCEGGLEDKVFEDTGCCAGQSFNAMENICCENILRPIGNVPLTRAKCCGNKCYFSGTQRCCNDRIYQSNVRTNNTCSDF